MSEPIVFREVAFCRTTGPTDTIDWYESVGRWGSVAVGVNWPRNSSPQITIAGLSVPPVTPEIMAYMGIEPPDDTDGEMPRPALEYAAEVLKSCPVGMFRYLPMEHESGGILYRMAGGAIDRTGCILVYQGIWHGETIDRQIDVVFSLPMPHIQSFLETKAEEDRMVLRAGIEQKIMHLQAVLAAMGDPYDQ